MVVRTERIPTAIYDSRCTQPLIASVHPGCTACVQCYYAGDQAESRSRAIHLRETFLHVLVMSLLVMVISAPRLVHFEVTASAPTLHKPLSPPMASFQSRKPRKHERRSVRFGRKQIGWYVGEEVEAPERVT